ncbi:MAG: hypothetical protein DMG59_24690 [Acidobacteria bacterium]|nr:MAG: hypothetical protein DMG59_24690 [Acidobacteriota bacterium]
MKKADWVLFLFAWFSGCVPALLGQQLGQVQGTVEDPNDSAVIQAAVKLTPRAGGTALKTVTDNTGRFVFSGVQGGEYLLAVTMEGFEKAQLHLQVGLSPVPDQRIRLKIAEIKEDLTVSARADDPISPEQNATAVHLDGDWLKSLPAKYDGVLSTASLFVDPTANDAEGTKIVVDGVEGSTLDVPSSSIKTIAVNSNPYSVEFARPGKGRIEVATRGGSLRRFHKRFSFAFRNAKLDAHNPFDRVFPPRQREWMEGALDGPLVGGKATFFVGGDYLRDDNNTFVTAVTPSGPLSTTVPIPLRTAHVLGRTDIRLTPVNILSLRYNWTDNRLPNQGVGAFDLPGRGWNAENQTHELRLSETAIPTPGFMNEFRFDFKYRPKLARSVSDAPAVLVNGAFNSGGAQISRNDQEKDLEFQDIASYLHGKHSLRFGGVLKSRFIDYTDRSNFGGTFKFSDLGSFIHNQPFLYTVNLGDARVTFRQNEFAYFFQDEIRLRPRLSLLLGLRHELQSNLADHRNLAPRVALSAASADGRTVLRAGGGIFYQRQPLVLEEQFLLLNGSHVRQVVLSNPSLPIVGNLADLPNEPPPSVLRIDPRIRAPYALQASLGVERKLGRDTFLSAEYTILRGLKLYRQRDLNAPLPATGDRPDPNFVNVDQFETSGSSHSNSLTLGSRTTVFRGRLQLVSHYTFSHSIDDTSGMLSLPADNFNLRAERGRSDFDQRHRFSFAGVFKLPWNFSVGCVATVYSGIPYDITTGFDNNKDTVANDRPSVGNPHAPFNSFAVDGSLVGGNGGILYDGAQALLGGSLVPINGGKVRWLILPGPGNAGRNVGNGPGLSAVDLRLARKFVLREKGKGSREVEFRADAFNSLNTANWKNYVGVLTSPFFGSPNDARPGREIQLSVRLKF